MKKKTRRQLLIIGTIFVAMGLGGVILINLPTKKSPPAVSKVYFFKGEKLIAVERPLNPLLSPLQQEITALLAGPTAKERLAEIMTQIPSGVKLRGLKFQNGTAIVNLSRELENYGGGAARVDGLVAQIVYTATDIPGVKKVWIWLDGQKEVVLGGEGLVLDRPLGRSDVSR